MTRWNHTFVIATHQACTRPVALGSHVGVYTIVIVIQVVLGLTVISKNAILMSYWQEWNSYWINTGIFWLAPCVILCRQHILHNVVSKCIPATALVLLSTNSLQCCANFITDVVIYELGRTYPWHLIDLFIILPILLILHSDFRHSATIIIIILIWH